jgi:hypothetical protein
LLRLLVLPNGPKAIEGQQLAGNYFAKAAPVVEVQVARAGFRLAAWLDLIAERVSESRARFVGSEEL